MMEAFLGSSVVAAIIAGIVAFINAAFADKRTSDKLKAWTAAQQEDIEISAEERKLLMSGMIVILRKMQGDKLNGEVNETIKALNEFVNDKAHRTFSRK